MRLLSHQHNLAVHFSWHGTPFKIPAEVALCLFRLAQEALVKVAKHSQAKGAAVEVITKTD
jgi:signal transduction histidine kinase